MQPPVPRWARILAGVVSLVVAVHLVATALWVGPSNAIKDSVAAPLTSYMTPMFEQNWSLFAPVPIGIEYSLEVRAFDAELEPTDWTDVTALEVSNLLHTPLPSRATRMTRTLASTVRGQHRRLTEEERTVLAGSYHQDAWARLQAAFDQLDDDSGTARQRYVLRLDRAMTAYATEFTRAVWADHEPRFVQTRIVELSAPPPDAGDDHERARRERTFGRRPMLEYPGQDSETFADAIERFRS